MTGALQLLKQASARRWRPDFAARQDRIASEGELFEGATGRCPRLTSIAPRGAVPARSRVKFGSWNLVDGDLVGDAAQCTALRHWLEPAGLQQCGSLRVGNDRPGCQNRT